MRQIFQENSGRYSSARVMSFVALLVAVGYTFNSPDWNILLLWVTAAFVPKVIQKFAEK